MMLKALSTLTRPLLFLSGTAAHQAQKYDEQEEEDSETHVHVRLEWTNLYFRMNVTNAFIGIESQRLRATFLTTLEYINEEIYLICMSFSMIRGT